MTLAQLSEADLQVLQLLALNVYFLTSVVCDTEKLPIRLANNAGKKLLELHSEHKHNKLNTKQYNTLYAKYTDIQHKCVKLQMLQIKNWYYYQFICLHNELNACCFCNISTAGYTDEIFGI